MSGKNRMSASERREAILDAALGLFSERGFRGTTTREIAAAVGVTEPVLYEHFRTKSDLYTAIIDAKSEEGERRFRETLGPHLETDDDEIFFRKLAGLILQFYEDHPEHIRLFLYTGLESHELSHLCYQRHMSGALRQVAGYIKRRADQGAFRTVDPTLTAFAFVGMVVHHGLSTIILKHRPEAPDRKTVINAIVDIFLNGVARVKENQ
jgi:AcrR family transcriptional regulator